MMTTNPISIASYGQNPFPWRTNIGGLRGLGVLPAAAAAAVPQISNLLMKVKPIASAVAKVNKLAAKLGIGGVTQDRFIDRTFEVYSIFDNAGYKYRNEKPTDNGLYHDFKIGKSEVKDKYSTGNYHAEFQRLRNYVVARLNAFNPGLGDLYGQYFPEFPMEVYSDGKVSLGQMTGEPLTALKEFVKIAPGTFTSASQVQQVLAAAQAPTSAPASSAPATAAYVPPTVVPPGPPPAAQSSSAGLLIGGGTAIALAISLFK